MHVLLAGATGVLGRRIAPLLVREGHRVSALVRSPHGRAAARELEGLGVQVVAGDALDPQSVTRTLAATAPDVLMHQLTDLRTGDSASNAVLRRRATTLLVAAARVVGTTRVIAQSIAWAYEPTTVPATEDTVLDLCAADAARRRTVQAVADLERTVGDVPEAVVLRYGVLYGPDTWFAPDGLLAADAAAGRLVADDTVISFVHVDDAARAAVDALHWPPGPVNVCDDEPATAREWVPVYCAALGAPAPPTARPADPAGRGGRGADNARARDLGWSPRHPSWRSGLAVTDSANHAVGHLPALTRSDPGTGR